MRWFTKRTEQQRWDEQIEANANGDWTQQAIASRMRVCPNNPPQRRQGPRRRHGGPVDVRRRDDRGRPAGEGEGVVAVMAPTVAARLLDQRREADRHELGARAAIGLSNEAGDLAAALIARFRSARMRAEARAQTGEVLS